MARTKRTPLHNSKKPTSNAPTSTVPTSTVLDDDKANDTNPSSAAPDQAEPGDMSDGGPELSDKNEPVNDTEYEKARESVENAIQKIEKQKAAKATQPSDDTLDAESETQDNAPEPQDEFIVIPSSPSIPPPSPFKPKSSRKATRKVGALRPVTITTKRRLAPKPNPLRSSKRLGAKKKQPEPEPDDDTDSEPEVEVDDQEQEAPSLADMTTSIVNLIHNTHNVVTTFSEFVGRFGGQDVRVAKEEIGEVKMRIEGAVRGAKRKVGSVDGGKGKRVKVEVGEKEDGGRGRGVWVGKGKGKGKRGGRVVR
ncbi:hypothetical protein EJ04DRAFT_589797 [Polyplosphaeria fusca]|uniref:Uncharacterized protein n=1 Tax=Polyplosphaeria fusca TaxID=682080 RepID=A0A9P4V687_9PLEO|nr:hypothetical protein EJ04DRAFT_589797 [Polyplosphaeria fusca]